MNHAERIARSISKIKSQIEDSIDQSDWDQAEYLEESLRDLQEEYELAEDY